jgi:uncharacterized protein (DUF305 family)
VTAHTDDDLVSMCEDVTSVQLGEIGQLKQWLCDWYGRCGGPVVTKV